MRGWMGVGLVMLASCSSSEEADKPLGSGNGQCAQRAGSYVAKYTQRDGTCGEGVEIVQNVDEQPTAPQAPCTGKISYTGDNCEVTYNTVCPNDGFVKDGVLAITGHSKWNADATQGEAVEQWVLQASDGKTVCNSTYDVTITRQ